jgi:hypothetical protein
MRKQEILLSYQLSKFLLIQGKKSSKLKTAMGLKPILIL